MTLLLIDAQAGCAGDMFVAAAASLADCEDDILALPDKLGLDGVRCQFRDVLRGGMQCRKFDVLLGDHPAEELHPQATDSHRHEHGQHHHHEHGQHHHQHEHGQHQHHEHQHHEHRSLTVIEAMIDRAELDPTVQTRAKRLFRRLGEVEAAAHGVDIQQVHFHEVGAIDSLIDIVAAAVCIERLQLTACHGSPIGIGQGTVKTEHGILPVPAPATERLLRGMPCQTGGIDGEWCTPTGALILAELQPSFHFPVCTVSAAAWGAGGKDLHQRPNALRLRLADSQSDARLEHDRIVVLTSNLDDCSGEALGSDFQTRLFQAGAVDVSLQPILMKKGRPGQRLEVLAPEASAQAVANAILQHSSAIGLRSQLQDRLKLPRHTQPVSTPYGNLDVKICQLPDGNERISPEYEACQQAASTHQVPLARVMQAVYAAWS